MCNKHHVKHVFKQCNLDRLKSGSKRDTIKTPTCAVRESGLVQICRVGGQFAISVHQIVHDFTPPTVQNQYVKQGMGGRRSVAENAPCIGLA